MLSDWRARRGTTRGRLADRPAAPDEVFQQHCEMTFLTEALCFEAHEEGACLRKLLARALAIGDDAALPGDPLAV